MNIRVTAQTQTASALANFRRQQTNVARTQDQISTGLRIATASDGPADYVAINEAKSSSRRSVTYTQTLTDAATDLNTSVSALQEGNDALVRAKQIAQEGVDATLDTSSRSALATEVDSLIDRMVRAGNVQSDGKYLFGGTAVETPPFVVTAVNPGGQPTAVSYTGADTRASGLISPNQTVDTKHVGSQVFQKSGADAFAALIALRDTLRDASLTDQQRSAALSQQVGTVDAARNGLAESTGEQAAALASIQAIGFRVSDLKLSADTRSSDLESTDYAAAVVQLREQDNAFQATLAISAKLFQTSLIDFLR